MASMDTDTNIQTTPSDFDILSLLEGSDYPTREVILYTDTKSASQLKDLPKDQPLKVTEPLRKKIRDTSLVITVQGLEPGKVMDLYNGPGTDEDHINELVARSIISVKTGAGQADAREWTKDRVMALRRKLQVSEVAKLIEAVNDVSFDATLFDDAVDAGFSR